MAIATLHLHELIPFKQLHSNLETARIKVATSHSMGITKNDEIISWQPSLDMTKTFGKLWA